MTLLHVHIFHYYKYMELRNLVGRGVGGNLCVVTWVWSLRKPPLVGSYENSVYIVVYH